MQSSSSYRGGVFPSSTSSFESPRSSNPFASYSVQDNPLSGPAAGPASSPSTSATGAGASSYYYGSTTDGNGAAEAEDPWAGSSYYPSGSAAVTAPGPQAGSASNSGKGTSVATPGQAAVSGLLDESALPDIYHQAWRAAVAWSPAASTGSTFSGASPTSTSFLSLHKTLSAAAGLSASDTERIANLVSSSAASLPISASTGSLASGPFPGASSSPTKAPGVPSSSSRVTKAEYYVALALAALVQQKQAMSIEAVAARRSDPPVPTLDLSCFNNGNSLSHPSPQRQPSFGYATSPTQTRTHKVSQASSNDPWGSGANGSYNRAPAYSPSTGLHGENPLPSDSTSRLRRSSSTNPYSSFPPFEESEGGLGETSSLGGYDQTSPSSIVSSLGLPPFSSSSEFVRGLDSITVLQQHELAGTFLSRHTVYVVVSERRRTSVTRRYSDWIWLHEVLEKKYPSRIKMVLPPKRVGISARHLQIASDEQFLERRRRGLARYLSYVANHHAMRNERVINVFFNVDQDLSTWRKQNPDMETSDETQSQRLSSAQLSSVPTNLETTLATLREALPAVIDSSSRLCALLERVHHRNLASAADMLRAKMSLDSYGEILAGLSTGHAHAGRPKEVEEECLVLHRDMHKFSDALGHLAESAEVRSIEWENESLERLKLQREVWKGLLGLLDRYEQRLRHDAVDKTKKRIEANQTRFKALASATPESRKANYDEEVRKLLKSIEDDQDLVEKALQRREYLRYSLAQEIRWTWRWSTVLRVDLSNWSVRESEYQQRITRMWASLENALAIQE